MVIPTSIKSDNPFSPDTETPSVEKLRAALASPTDVATSHPPVLSSSRPFPWQFLDQQQSVGQAPFLEELEKGQYTPSYASESVFPNLDVRKDAYLFSGANAYRDSLLDETLSTYSSSVSRPNSPALSSYRGTPNPGDIDTFSTNQIADELAERMDTDMPLFALEERDATLQAAANTLNGHSTQADSAASLSRPSSRASERHTYFSGNVMSTSPATSPRQATFPVEAPSPSYSRQSYPPPGSGVPERKDSKLARLDIGLDAPSIELEPATATAGPATARPGGGHVLDQIIAGASGVCLPYTSDSGLD